MQRRRVLRWLDEGAMTGDEPANAGPEGRCSQPDPTSESHSPGAPLPLPELYAVAKERDEPEFDV